MLRSKDAVQWSRVLELVLILTVVGGTLYTGVAALNMARAANMSGMSGMSGMDPGTSGKIQGMPLDQMPEMWVVGAAFVLLLVASFFLRPKVEFAPVKVKRPILQVLVLSAALAIDVSKTSTLGFVIPGMRVEYGLSATAASFLAVAGLLGTTVGAVFVRFVMGRLSSRRIYLLAALGFAATSCCAMMPTFVGNLVMCFLMGVTVGALAPVLISSIRAIASSANNPSSVVTASIVASTFGFLIASGTAAWLIEAYGWRVMWLIGIPTGIFLALISPFIQDIGASEKFGQNLAADGVENEVDGLRSILARHRAACYSFALVSGVVSFGVATWVPTLAQQTSPGSYLPTVTAAALALIPAGFVIGYLSRRRGTSRVLKILAAATGSFLFILAMSKLFSLPPWVFISSLLATLFCVNAASAILLPAASHMVQGIGRVKFVAGVSAFNRVGGLLGPVALSFLVSEAAGMTAAIAVLGATYLVVTFLTVSSFGLAQEGVKEGLDTRLQTLH